MSLLFYNEVVKFIKKVVKETILPRKLKKVESELKRTLLKHYERTVFWVKKLKPDADEALLIAAYSHDIERWFRPFLKPNDIKGHQRKSAKIVSEFLSKIAADKEMVQKVYYLISHHEEGGSHEANILKDADSISFFENNLALHAKLSPKTLRKKIEWMYRRITSPEAKKICKPLYERAIKSLRTYR